MTAASLISGHFSNANDIAGAPLGFGNVLFFSVEKATPVVFAPMSEAAPQSSAFLA